MMPGTEREITRIAQSLSRIANVLEAQEKRAREVTVDPSSLGAAALWRAEVSNGITLLGFTDWLAWHESDAEAWKVTAAPADRAEET